MQKKKQKLLLQVSAIILIIFFGAVVYVAVSNYFITREAFLSSKTEMIDRDLLDLREKGFKKSIMGWFFQFLEDHPELEIFREMTQAELEMDDETFVAIVEDYVLNENFSIEGLDLAGQLAVEKAALVTMALMFSQANSRNYDRAFLLDVLNEEESYLILDYREEYVDAVRGGVIRYPASEHPVVSDVLSGNVADPEKTIYEVFHDGESGKDFYIGYLPLVSEGKTEGLLCIQYDWSEFNSQLIRNSVSSIVIGFLVLLLLNGLLILFLYRKAIFPLSKVEDAVVGYMDDKDSRAVSDKMNGITVRNEIGVLAGSFSSLATEIDRYTKEILALNEEKARIGAELELATRIQADMLPNVFPAFPERREFDIFASMTPAKEVGGDFYDFFLIDDDHLGMVMADVSGKGVPAALFMMMTKILVNNLAVMGGSPAKILEQVNAQICKNNEEEMFVTVWFGVLEISTGKVTAANAGHEYPIIKRADGGFELFKDKHGFVIGGMAGMRYKDYELTLEKGGTLFLYTDGVAEAVNTGNELFGTDRMLETLNRDPDADPKTLLENMKKSVDEFAGDAPQFDDLTMLGVKLL